MANFITNSKLVNFYDEVATIEDLKYDLSEVAESLFTLAMQHESVTEASLLMEHVSRLGLFLDVMKEVQGEDAVRNEVLNDLVTATRAEE